MRLAFRNSSDVPSRAGDESGASSPAAAVHIEGITKSFGPTRVLRGVGLEVQPREFVCILGPSGCGKTTLLRIVAGFVRPDAGKIILGGEVVAGRGRFVPPERRSLGMIFQGYALWPHMSVFNNVAYGLRVRRVPRREIKERVSRVLELVRLNEMHNRYPGQLSGGQQQRVALARALVVEPVVLLLDEPLSNLDANLRESLRLELRRVHDQMGITSVYVTHDRTEALALADRIVVMNDGFVDQDGTPEQVMTDPQTEFVARLMGNANTYSGVLVDQWVVEGDNGRMEGFPVGDLPAAGDTASVVVLPKDVSLAEAGSESTGSLNVIPGTLVRGVHLGDHWEYLVQLEGTEATWRVVTQTAAPFEVGDAVGMRVPAERCRLYSVPRAPSKS